jgi:hypothetical protein
VDSMNRRAFLRASAGLLATPSLGESPSAQGVRREMSDVIVVLPGIMGSVLAKDGRDLWALSGSAIARGLRTGGGSLGELRLAGDSEKTDSIDGITATRLVSDVHLVPGFWKIDGYTGLSTALRNAFAIQPGVNYFEFPYDWRRDIRVAARRLERSSRIWLTAWRTKSGNKDARLILLCHSMGGLVGRYFVECLEGWRTTKLLATFGTPFRGSPNALNTLSNGLSIGPIDAGMLTSVVRSFTSMYQLLPRYPCYDSGAGLVRVGDTTGIPNVDPARAQSALKFHFEIDQCVEAHLENDNYQKTFAVLPIVGGYQPTLQSARLVNGKTQMLHTHPLDPKMDGDGTVPEASAIPLELSDRRVEFYVSQRHASLQNTPAVLNHLVRAIRESNFADFKVRENDSRANPDPLRLEINDFFTIRDRIAFTVQRSAPSGSPPNATVQNADSGAVVAQGQLPPQSGTQSVFVGDFAPLPEGAYRIQVTSPSSGSATTDVFLVGQT